MSEPRRHQEVEAVLMKEDLPCLGVSWSAKLLIQRLLAKNTARKDLRHVSDSFDQIVALHRRCKSKSNGVRSLIKSTGFVGKAS